MSENFLPNKKTHLGKTQYTKQESVSDTAGGLLDVDEFCEILRIWKERGLQAAGFREAQMLPHEQDMEHPARGRGTIHPGEA